MTNLFSRTFVDTWRAAGLAGPLPEILEDWLATDARLVADGRERYATLQAAPRERARALAAGDKQARTKTAQDYRAEKAAVARDFRAAREYARDAAERKLRLVGDALILDHLQPAHARLLADAAGPAELIGTLRDPDEAMRPQTTDEAREAWITLARLWAERGTLFGLLHGLILEDVVQREAGVDETVWRQYARPDGPPDPQRRQNMLAFRRRQSRSVPEARRMADLVLDGGGRRPGLYTAAEIRANGRAAMAEETEFAQRAAQPEPKPQRPTAGQEKAAARRATESQEIREAHRDAEFVARQAQRPRQAKAEDPMELAALVPRK